MLTASLSALPEPQSSGEIFEFDIASFTQFYVEVLNSGSQHRGCSPSIRGPGKAHATRDRPGRLVVKQQRVENCYKLLTSGEWPANHC